MTKYKTFMGDMWGEDKGRGLPLKTKPLIGNATKCGNVWREKK